MLIYLFTFVGGACLGAAIALQIWLVQYRKIKRLTGEPISLHVQIIRRLTLENTKLVDQANAAVTERDALQKWITDLSKKVACYHHIVPSDWCAECGHCGALVARAEKAEAALSQAEDLLWRDATL